MIAPTQQQNKPNIEIQPMIFSNYDNSRLLLVNDFSYYDISFNNWSSMVTFNTNALKTSFNSLYLEYDSDSTYTTSNRTFISIIDSNVYVYMQSTEIYGSVLRSVLREFFTRTRGSAPTNESFSFQTTASYLPNVNTFYNYSLSNSFSTINGRVYMYAGNANNSFSTTQITNTNVTLPTNSTLQQVMNSIIPINIGGVDSDTKVLYYFLDSSIPLGTAGTYTRQLYSRNNYGRLQQYGTFNLTLVADTTPPTITTVTGNPTNWTNQSATITVQATDNVSLNAAAYSFNGGSTWQQSNQFTTNINQTLQIRVRDSSGNIASQDIVLNRFDITAPSINLAGNWKNNFELGELTSNNDLLNYLSINDLLSGINSSLTTIQNFNYNVAGQYSNIQVSATDNAGNNNVFTLPTVTITQPADTTGPIITGPTQVTRTINSLNSPVILDLFNISDISGVVESRIQTTDGNINWQNTITTTGSYQLRVYARDTLDNITQYQFTLIVESAPLPDTTPPQIIGPLLVSFEIGTYSTNTEILNLYTYQDNVAILQTQLIGTIDYETLGDYPVQIKAIDTSNNETIKYVTIRIRDEQTLGNYNPLTDLFNGIFGGLLSMIFTIGTISMLGIRLLDAMGVIILGAVIFFVYKAIKGGS